MNFKSYAVKLRAHGTSLLCLMVNMAAATVLLMSLLFKSGIATVMYKGVAYHQAIIKSPKTTF